MASQVPTEPILRLYLLSVASIGVYLMFWSYRAARRLEPEANRIRHASWAVGTLFPPFACILLYEILRLARGQRYGWEDKDAFSWVQLCVAPTVLMVLATLLYFTRVWPLWSPAWLLLPLPFVAVQHQLNRLARASEIQPQRLSRRWLWALIALGLPAVAALGYRWDRDNARDLIASRRLLPGAQVTGKDGGYSVVVPEDGWRILPSPGVDPNAADITLSRQDGRGWMATYVYLTADTSIDGAVETRRNIISDADKLDSLDESRFFLEGADLVPVSLAHFRVHHKSAGRGLYVVLTVALKEKIYELVGYTTDPDAKRLEIMHLLMSFKPIKGPS